MSVIIFYKNSVTSKNDYIEIRSLGGKVGIDKTGNITNKEILEQYFSIYAIGKEYVLTTEKEKILLPKYFSMNINNVEFFFYTIYPTNESLTYTYYDEEKCSIKDKKFLTLNICHNLANISINIYEGVEYYLGSSAVSSICINESFVAPYHAKITYENDEIKITNIAGAIKKESEKSYSLHNIALEFE